MTTESGAARGPYRDTFSEAIEAALSAGPTAEQLQEGRERRARRRAALRRSISGVTVNGVIWAVSLVTAAGVAVSVIIEA